MNSNIPTTTFQMVLQSRPSATDSEFSDAFFALVESPIPALKDGEALVRAKVFSCDPTQRVWITDVPQYMPPVQLGEAMRSSFGGTVIASQSAKFVVGDNVVGLGEWSEHMIVSDANPYCGKLPASVPLELGVAAGLCPETAYLGLVCVGRVRPGDTVVVTGAAGATGSAVVQIAKIAGCRVIGVAGGVDKCAYVKELGADECIDYKNVAVGQRLNEIAKDAVDIVFDNVGGEQLDACLSCLAMNARVVICGAISQYNALGASTVAGPANYLALLNKRATMQGFIYGDNPGEVAEARTRIGQWLLQGKLTIKLDPRSGTLTELPSSVRRLFSGDNNGKVLHILRGE
jgi:NADPH-dependent curcumin reductase CurA